MAVIRKPPTGTSSLKKINRSSPPEPQTFTGQEFFSETEHGYNYVRHPVASRYQPPKAPYVPNGNKLDGMTNHQADYKAWPVSAPPRHQAAKYEPNNHEFAFTESTSKADYSAKPLPPPQRKVQQYVNSAANMGFSTGSTRNSIDAGSAADGANGLADAVYKGGYVKNRAKFEGVTSQQADFQAWPTAVPPRHQQQKYVPNEHTIPTGTTTQKSDFTPKPLGEHYVHPQPVYNKSGDQMESTTTHKASYLKWQIEQQPLQKYKNLSAPKPGQASIINIGNH